MRRKFLSLLLAVCMVLTMLPATVFAAELPQRNEMEGIEGLAGDAKAITLSKKEATVTPDNGDTVLITPPDDAGYDFWCSVTGNEKNVFTASSDFLNSTESNPLISGGKQPIFFKSTDNVAPGTYTMTVTIYGKNHQTSEAYTPATLTVKMTVGEPTAKWGTDETYVVGSGTLKAAMTYANSLNDGTAYIQLQSNVDITETLAFSKTAVLDLNGKTIDAKENCSALAVFGNLTLTDSVGSGKITGGCASSGYGSGVYVGASGSFTMTGGEITGNTAFGNGAGVYVAGSMAVGGKAKIIGNTSGSTASNVYLTSGKTIAVCAVPLVNGASIGVKMQTAPSSAAPVSITGASGSDVSGFFVSDSDAYVIQNSGSGAAQVVQLAASGQTTDVLISTAEGLRNFASAVNAGDNFEGKFVKLTSNIALTGEWTPIGTMEKPFAGTFDGQGYTVSGMSITGNASDTGFFLATNGATVQNLTVSGSINVTGQSTAGGIVALALADTILNNCHSAVQITAKVAGGFNAGGIAGRIGSNVKIDGCSNSSEINVTGTSNNEDGDELYVGGITGIILGSGSFVKSCASTGALTASTLGSDGNTVYLGGIIGHLMASGDASVINCYSAGTLNANASGSTAAGGIAGLNFNGAIINCYHSGLIASTAGSGKTNSVGGIVGCSYNSSVTGSYWKAGTADHCVNSLGDNYIYHCGSFDTAGALTATTDTNAGTEHAQHGLPYGSTLLASLNAWVRNQTATANYQTWTVKSGVNGGYPVFGAESVAAPTFSPAGGIYSAAQKVTISCATTGADIYYTTNGSTPTTGSAKYTTPISVSATTTLKAIAVKSGLEDSDVATATYTIQTGGGHTGGSHNPPAANKPETVVTVPAEVPASIDSKGDAIVTVTQDKLSEILKEAQKIAAQQGVKKNGIVAELTVNTPTETQSLTITFPKAIQDTLVKEGVVELKIHSSAIQISLDKACISAIQSTAGTDALMTAKPAAVRSTEAKAAIGNRPVFDLTLTCGGKTMNHFGAGKVSVGIPYTLGKNEQASNIAVVYVDAAGKVTWLKQSSYDATQKMAFFTTDHFSTYGVAYKPDASAFSDIDAHWAKDNILFVTNRGVFTGIGNGKFGPDLPLTREMFVTALGRLAQADVSAYQQSSFSDVKEDAYSMGYIEWANKNSIVNGIGNGKFAPNQAITREQMASIIQNYTNIVGVTLPKVHTEDTFADSAELSAYAKEAVKQMQMAGILSGKPGNLFDPQGNATRAEVSAVFKRLVELTINSDKPQG